MMINTRLIGMVEGTLREISCSSGFRCLQTLEWC